MCWIQMCCKMLGKKQHQTHPSSSLSLMENHSPFRMERLAWRFKTEGEETRTFWGVKVRDLKTMAPTFLLPQFGMVVKVSCCQIDCHHQLAIWSWRHEAKLGIPNNQRVLFHRIHSPLVTWFFLFIQFVSISGFTAILRSFTQAWQQHHEPWPFCVVFGRGTPQFHNLATPPSRTPQLELELLPRLGETLHCPPGLLGSTRNPWQL